MNNYREKFVIGCLAVMLPVSGFACSMAEWDTPTGVGAVIVGSPQTATTVARYSEFCGLQVTAPNTGHVQDNSPDGHTQFIVRFYVRPNLTGTGQVELFAAYGDEAGGSPKVKVSYDGTNIEFHADSGPVASKSVAAAKNLWHLVEIEYNSAGSTRYWVNADSAGAESGSYTSASGPISSVRLGLLPGTLAGFSGGSAQFDAYESRSTTPVGPLLNGDANANGSITIADVTKLGGELNGNLANGQPDCNRNGAVSITDVTCVAGLLP